MRLIEAEMGNCETASSGSVWVTALPTGLLELLLEYNTDSPDRFCNDWRFGMCEIEPHPIRTEPSRERFGRKERDPLPMESDAQ